MFAQFNITCSCREAVILDASCQQKFSKHVIFNLSNHFVFNSIKLCGVFVEKIGENLRSFLAGRPNSYLPLDMPISRLSKLGNLLIFKRDGSRTLFWDCSVYTNNRNFRLILSSKRGEKRPLIFADENCFPFHNDDVSAEFPSLNTFKETLVCAGINPYNPLPQIQFPNPLPKENVNKLQIRCL